MTTTFAVPRPSKLRVGDYLSLLRFRFGRGASFDFQGRRFSYFIHSYNRTWRNERIVEVSLSMDVVNRFQSGSILEFGNVLSHYYSFPHDVVDKYESSPGVINEDIVDFTPRRPYDLVVSISTLEHVGWDETPRDPHKISRALEVLKACLKPGGFLFMTAPLGYNPEHDAFLEKNTHLFDRVSFLKRRNRKNEWTAAEAGESWGSRFGHPYRAANALAVLEWTRRPTS